MNEIIVGLDRSPSMETLLGEFRRQWAEQMEKYLTIFMEPTTGDAAAN